MKILIPVDGSRYSENAVAFVAQRSTLIGENPEILLINVQAQLPGRALGLMTDETLKALLHEEFEAALAPARKIFNDANITFEEKTLVGKAATVIADQAIEFDADLIIMGSHGHTATQGLLYGSVTNGVLSLTKIPVLVLRNVEEAKAHDMKVAVAVDGSPNSENTVKYLLRNLNLFGHKAHYEILNAVFDHPSLGMMPSWTGVSLGGVPKEEVQRLQKAHFEEATMPAVQLFEARGITPQTTCLVGHPGKVISQYINENKFDVIVMGSHGYGRLLSAMMGSTALRIASQTTVPLLIVKN